MSGTVKVTRIRRRSFCNSNSKSFSLTRTNENQSFKSDYTQKSQISSRIKKSQLNFSNDSLNNDQFRRNNKVSSSYSDKSSPNFLVERQKFDKNRMKFSSEDNSLFSLNYGYNERTHNGRSFANSSKNGWPNLINRRDKHDQVLPIEKKKKKNVACFGQLCCAWCIFCSLLAAVLIGALIAALVLSLSKTSLSTSLTKITMTTITTTSATTTTISSSTSSTTTVTSASTSTISTVSSTSTTVTTGTTSTTSTTETTSTISETTTSTTSTTSGTTICSTTAITTTITSTSLPIQCSTYTLITDGTRNAAQTGTSPCDQSLFSSIPTWVRFDGAAGTMLANCQLDPYRCNANAPGWYSGIYPSQAGQTTNGTVCYVWYLPTYPCYWSNSISITNCNGYYVFALVSPPACNLRYCTI